MCSYACNATEIWCNLRLDNLHCGLFEQPVLDDAAEVGPTSRTATWVDLTPPNRWIKSCLLITEKPLVMRSLCLCFSFNVIQGICATENVVSAC